MENLTIKTSTHVDRIILEKNSSNNRETYEYKAVGVEVQDDASGQRMIIKSRKEIILCAG